MSPASDLKSVLSLSSSRGLCADIAARLRSAILGGHFGPGEQLCEEALARAMDVSRGPIREGLVQLEREGLIVIRRNRGAFLAQLSREDLEEVYTLRVAIERQAIERAVEVLIDHLHGSFSPVAARHEQVHHSDIAATSPSNGSHLV